MVSDYEDQLNALREAMEQELDALKDALTADTGTVTPPPTTPEDNKTFPLILIVAGIAGLLAVILLWFTIVIVKQRRVIKTL